MKFLSPAMKKYLNEIEFDPTKVLPCELQKLIDSGFTIQSNGTFFASFFSESINSTLNSKNYFDLSGFEFTINKFHVEDYCDELDPFNTALVFLKSFIEKWRADFPDQICNACVSFQDDVELGRLAIFSFYRERSDQIVINFHEIDTFDEPIYFEQTEAI